MEYMITRAAMEPRVYNNRASAAAPIIMMPLRMVSRSEKAAKRCGMYAVGIGRPEILCAADETIPSLAMFRRLRIVTQAPQGA